MENEQGKLEKRKGRVESEKVLATQSYASGSHYSPEDASEVHGAAWFESKSSAWT